MLSTDRQVWIAQFRSAAKKTLGAAFDLTSARPPEWEADELGQRRPLDRAFLACVLGPAAGLPQIRDPAMGLWMIAAAGTGGSREAAVTLQPGRGSLLGLESTGTIETSTETELSALHAAWRIARCDSDHTLRERCLHAATWAVGELQPDNATNRPWAAHVFVELWLARRQAGAGLYAQTLLHNCQVSFGKPDRISALVLWDAAAELGHAS